MYLRHSTIKNDGKDHTYWRSVRSVRVGGKVRQETVAQLGEVDAELRRWMPAFVVNGHLVDRVARQIRSQVVANEPTTHRRPLELPPRSLGVSGPSSGR
jgi:hypothetical protein